MHLSFFFYFFFLPHFALSQHSKLVVELTTRGSKWKVALVLFCSYRLAYCRTLKHPLFFFAAS